MRTSRRSEPGRSGPERRSGESGAPMVGCLGCLVVAGIAVVDLVPFLALQASLAKGAHALWAEVAMVVVGLGVGPVVATLVGYLAFRSRDRLLTAIEARWPGRTTRESAAALDLSELTSAFALLLAIASGAAIGAAVVVGLDAILP